MFGFSALMQVASNVDIFAGHLLLAGIVTFGSALMP
jgi:hypothetical protein